MKKAKVVDFNHWLDKRLKNGKFKVAYESANEDSFINVALQIISLREKNNLTQAQLVKKVKTSRQAIARLESLRYRGYTLDSLNPIAKALHRRVQIQFV